MKSVKQYNVPLAILVAGLMVSLSILVSGGVITVKNNKSAVNKENNPSQAQVEPIPQQPTLTLDQIKNTFNKSLIKFGDTNKKLVAIEVADPSCPYCQIAAGKNPELNKQAGARFTLVSDGGSYVAPVPEIKKLVDSGRASFAFVYYPGHGNGEMGTKAFYCGFESGKFWEVHDLLMSSKGYDVLNNTVKNDKSKSQELADFLQPVIDPGVMKQCLDSGKYDTRLKDDMALAASLNINGTPGFYLNDKSYAGAYSYADMESAANSFLK